MCPSAAWWRAIPTLRCTQLCHKAGRWQHPSVRTPDWESPGQTSDQSLPTCWKLCKVTDYMVADHSTPELNKPGHSLDLLIKFVCHSFYSRGLWTAAWLHMPCYWCIHLIKPHGHQLIIGISTNSIIGHNTHSLRHWSSINNWLYYIVLYPSALYIIVNIALYCIIIQCIIFYYMYYI